MYCDTNCTLLGLQSFLVSGCRVWARRKQLPQHVLSLLLHPSFSGWTEHLFAAVKGRLFCILLLTSHASLSVRKRNFPSTMIPDFWNECWQRRWIRDISVRSYGIPFSAAAPIHLWFRLLIRDFFARINLALCCLAVSTHAIIFSS